MKTDRETALSILQEYTKSNSLLKHAFAVEQAMKSYAKKFGEDTEKWGFTGLLHDFDYEMYPSIDEHPYKGVEILKNKGVDEDILQAILGHAEYTNTPRKTLMAKTLFAVDELCGFLMACGYVRPDKKISNLEVKSVKKKLKDKSFAKGVNRDDIEKGILELGVDKDEHIKFVIDSLAEIEEILMS
ncbi:MAG: HDIG domain-containing protein [Deferribacterales bacterium]|uniref:HD domain-containing protein n=1 Tax=Deferrivibrio essentukiensis TaxID=2880922 RepID=UPI0019A1C154|nr:HDIG domain-containing protein [Deferribacterales bacterium]MBZ4672505.1 metal dependent phosphohydrolase [Deferribacteraceae bacterium]MCB4204672.1 HDIG domain-containing protein [Deferrivibrio essentukiensis]